VSQNQIIVLNSDPEIIIIQDTGVQGVPGVGIPTGGLAGQVLGKASNANYDTTWFDPQGVTQADAPLVIVGGHIQIPIATAQSDGYLSALDFTTFAQKQDALGFTPENIANKGVANGYAPLDGSNLIPVAYIPPGVVGGLTFLGLWNASTNTPVITSGVGTNGDYYKVSVAGNTIIDGIGNWAVGDWIIFNGTAWDKIANYESVISVNGQTGAVVLGTADISETGTNYYYTDARSRGSVSALTPLAYDSGTGQFTIQQSSASQAGFLSASDFSTFQSKQNALSFGSLSEATSSVLTITNGAGAVIGTGTAIQVKKSSGSQDGYLASTDFAIFYAKEPAITAGTTAQYFRGDKTFQTLDTSVVPENGPLYYTNARTIGSTLTGYVSGAGTISPTDSILSAIQKLNGNIGALVTGVSSVNGQTGAVSLTTTNISEGTQLYFTDARTYLAQIASFTPSAGTITAGDSLQTILQKLQGNISNVGLYTFSTGLTNTAGTITANLSTGVAGGQGVIGGTASGNALTLSSTSNATKGKIFFGTSAYD